VRLIPVPATTGSIHSGSPVAREVTAMYAPLGSGYNFHSRSVNTVLLALLE
jgi:hypothetical protein